MAAAPEIRYTRSADGTNLAYQLSGEGPLDLVFLHVAYPIDLLSEDPGFVRLRRRLGTFSRSVWFDARGNGASESDFQDALRQEIFDADLIAVLNAVGFERPAVVAEGWPGLSAIRFSVTHPDLVSSLVLINSYAHGLQESDYPWGAPPETIEPAILATRESWGTAAPVELLAPTRVADERFRAWYARAARFSGGPDVVADMIRAGLQDDVRPLLASIAVPALVLHREGDRYVGVGNGRYLAEHIPDARFVVVPGDDHLFFVGDTDTLVDEIEEFLTGFRSGAEGEVVMVAVLFTDIVASTQHQSRIGPREWSRLTDRHDAMVRAALIRNRGHEVKTMGDGFLATFDATGRALRCASEIVADAKNMGLDLRAGVHTGEVEARGDDISGLAVAIAKRVCDMARPGEVLVSETVRSTMVGTGIAFNSQGDHELKGVPGTWTLKAVRHLRDYNGSIDRWWSDFRSRVAFTKPADENLLMILAISACFSADPDGTPRLPFDPHDGVLDRDVWGRWLDWDPVRMVPHYADALRSQRAIWIDGGTSDQWFLEIGGQAFSDALGAIGITDLHFELFEGAHGRIEYRYPMALGYLAERLSEPSRGSA